MHISKKICEILIAILVLIPFGLLLYAAWQDLNDFTGVAHAQANLEFGTVDLLVPGFDFSPSDYKATRAKEICEMAKEYGLQEHCNMLIAHLYHECNAMTETCSWTPGSSRNDYGYAIGMAQWHVCWREYEWAHKKRPGLPNGYCWKTKTGMAHDIKNAEKMRAEFFRDFPEMLDWRFQARRYLHEISEKAKPKITAYSVRRAIDSWNSNPAYMSMVTASLPKAKQLLSPL